MSDNKPALTVKSLIQAPAYRARFEEVLKSKAPGFLASISSLTASGPLAKADPASVMAAAFVAATLDLPVDKNLGFAWVVPYGQVAQFQLGYKGYIQLAQRTGLYHRMNAFMVNAQAVGGFDDVGEPIIHFDKLDDAEPAVGYAFAFRLTNGFTKLVYWTKEKVERHAKRYSKAFTSGPWKTNFDEMALKTVARHTLGKWGPLSVELQAGLRHDQGSQKDIEAEVVYPDGGNEKTIQQGKVGALTDTNPLDDQQQPEQDSVGTEARETTEPVGTGNVAEQSAAPAAPATPAATTKTSITDGLRSELKAKMDAAGITEEDLNAHFAKQEGAWKDKTFANMTGKQIDVLLKDWDTTKDDITGA